MDTNLRPSVETVPAEPLNALGIIAAEPYYADASGRFVLYHGDSIVLLTHARPEAVDVIFADPPYNLSNGGVTCHSGRMVSVDKGSWDKSRGVIVDHEFNVKWLSVCRTALSTHGTIWVSGTNHVIHSVGFALQTIGFKILNDIVWYKKNAPPNLSCRYFTHSTEFILWAAKSGKSRHIFNYARMKQLAGGKQMRNVWVLAAPAAEEKRFGKHPTQKPLGLLRRILEASAKPGALVLDPFNGSGTTGLAAHSLGLPYIGIDTDKSYLDLTVRRFEAMGAQLDLLGRCTEG